MTASLNGENIHINESSFTFNQDSACAENVESIGEFIQQLHHGFGVKKLFSFEFKEKTVDKPWLESVAYNCLSYMETGELVELILVYDKKLIVFSEYVYIMRLKITYLFGGSQRITNLTLKVK